MGYHFVQVMNQFNCYQGSISIRMATNGWSHGQSYPDFFLGFGPRDVTVTVDASSMLKSSELS